MKTSIQKKRFLDHYLPVKSRFEKYCLALAGDADHAKDIASETILLAYEGFSKIKDRNAFIFYLFKIARRLNYKRYKKKVLQVDYTDQALISQDVDAVKRLYIDQLHQCIKKLPAKTGNAIVLYEISGFSIKEVATIQKSTESAVKVRLMRGRNRLRQMLGEDADSSMKLNKTG